MHQHDNPNAVAVIGMAGRFPGADSVDALWQRLLAVDECVTHFDQDAPRDDHVPAPGAAGALVPAKGVLADADCFDASFFGYSARDADILDPQHRVFLETAWHALEDAGIDPAASEGRIGCFAGSSMNSYLLNNLSTRPDVVDQVGPYQVLLASDKDFLATRTSHRLGLTGPSLTVQTACSTSLTAVHLAVQSLLSGECDVALAGGVSVTTPLAEGYLFVPGGILSADGRCRAFDVDAGGTVPGNGVGVVVLKRLADAQDDRDRIDAVVLGSAVNNDGDDKVGYTAPSVNGQAAVIAEAVAVAQVPPESIGYVETHGTGTALGDPIELAALSQAIGAGRDGSSSTCALGAVKPTIGHLDAAAGIAGFIKAVLVVRDGQVPGVCHFTQPHPALGLDATPFTISGSTRPWCGPAGPRRAGVSAFGIGGTNAHVVIEEPPGAVVMPPARADGPYVLALSGDTPDAVVRQATAIAGHWAQDMPLCAVASTLATRRRHLPYRTAVAVEDPDQARRRLGSLTAPTQGPRRAGARPVFLFPGQGAQYPGMGRALYRSERVFREVVDTCSAGLVGVLGLDLRDLLLADRDDDEAARLLTETRIAQPALFTVEYSLARAWIARGGQPSGMVGHSIGELVAATVAGVFDPDRALELVAERGRLVQAMERGRMLAVHVAADSVTPLLGEGLSLAAINAPDLCVVAGPEALVQEVAEDARVRGWTASPLRTSHAFHSASMDAAAAAFADRVAREDLKEPRLPFCSNVTGTWIRPEEATCPAYWGGHLRATVRFKDCLTTVLQERDAVLVELGPGDTLRAFAARHPDLGEDRIRCGSLPHPKDRSRDDVVFLQGVGQAWAAGVPVHLVEPDVPTGPPVLLPVRPFRRDRHWVDPGERRAGDGTADATVRPAAARVSVPLWRRLAPGGDAGAVRAEVVGNGPIADALRLRATNGQEGMAERAAGRDVVLVAPSGDGSPEDAAAAVEWFVQHVRELGAGATGAEPVRATLVTMGARDVVGTERIDPVATALTCASRVAGQEFDHLTCRGVDVDDVVPDASLDALVRLLGRPDLAGPLAVRGGHAWVEEFGALDAPTEAPSVRPDASYLVTGGFGGIGLAVARELVEAGAGVVGLLGRTPPPAGRSWSELAGDARWAGVASLVAQVRDRARIVPLTADVTDELSVRAAVDMLRRHAPLRGVVHAAGVPSAGVMLTRTAADAGRVLAPKTTGTDLVAAACADDDLDFFWLTSSLTALVGGPGQVDYAAANGYQLGWAARARRGGLPATAIAWDTWRGVGMARGVVSALAGDPVAHPLLGSRSRPEAGSVLYEVAVSPDTHWVLADHRLQGHGLMPGTAYLEMVRAAVHEERPGTSFELADVMFLQPVVVPDGSEVRLQLRLEERGPDQTFTVRSRVGGRWVDHALGRITGLGATGAGPTLDRPGGWAGTWPETLADEDEVVRRLRLDQVQQGPALTFAFGERWRCLDLIRIDGDWLEVDLALAAPFAGEAEAFGLHPALLDVAGAAARVRATDVYYLPLTYRSLRFLAPLTATVTCRVRVSEGEDSGETMSCDMDILSPAGELLVQFRGFSIKRINDVTALVAQVDDLVTAAAEQPQEDATGGGESLLGRLAAGMPLVEATAVLRRLLRAGDLPAEVAASRLPVGALRELGLTITPAAIRAELESLAGPAPEGRHARPELDTALVAPRDEDEAAIAAIWAAALGLEEVGVHDDFFALGGHSLVAVQIGAMMRSELAVDLELRDFFEDPTVAGVAALVRARRDTPIEAAASMEAFRWATSADDVADLTDEEVEAQLLALLQEGTA